MRKNIRKNIRAKMTLTMVIVGENEQKNESVSVRQRDAEFGKQELGEMRLEGFIELLKKSEQE